MNKRRLNLYVCMECRKSICTIDRDEGVTPMFLNCRATPGCRGTMHSAGYPEEMPEYSLPTWEWYRPDEKVILRMTPEMQEHIRSGGLDLRQVGFKVDNPHSLPFQGEMMTCCMCGKQWKSHPRIESDWTTITLDSTRYYICPKELQGRGSKRSKEEAAAAMSRVMLHIVGEKAAGEPNQ